MPIENLNSDVLGIGRIRAYANGTFVPRSNGPVVAKLFPARDCSGRQIDIVAVELTTNSPWWLHRGRAVYLGEDVLDYSARRGWPVWLAATPDEWLTMNGFALCVLNWSADLYPTLGRTQLVIERQDLANHVQRVLIRQRGLNARIWTYEVPDHSRPRALNAGGNIRPEPKQKADAVSTRTLGSST